MNNSKFRLKHSEDLEALLENRDDWFILACGKCFDSCNTKEIPEAEQFASLAAAKGRHITGFARLDFLCNEVRTGKQLPELLPEGTRNIAAVSCGLGVQTAAALTAIPVWTVTDSVTGAGQHGMALTEKSCDACAQCYLSATGGLCPITDCAKGLLNGACGGAKNGKCEVDPRKDCVWEKIALRLHAQGRSREFLSQPIQLRDYSKAGTAQVRKAASALREKRADAFFGGVHPLEHKDRTQTLPLQHFPEPETVTIPMSMHAGTPAVPAVRPGDEVKLGQLIGHQNGFISAPVHASVSGMVLAVENRRLPGKEAPVLCVTIANDGKNTLHESVRPGKPIEELTPAEIARIVQEKGIVGMGGATFPTYIKLNHGKPIRRVILNGSECEPYLTADHRMMLEYGDDILYGLRAIMKAVGAPEGVIFIENNKPDAIAQMTEKAAPWSNIRICTAESQYPQGSEKMIIKKVTGQQVPRNGYPADVGCTVINVSTARAVSDAIRKGMPPVERPITVSGEYIRNPRNLIVKVGTGVKDILAYCGGVTDSSAAILLGGPMMGTALADTDTPILKGTNGILAIPPSRTEPQDCIRCGRCVDVCPAELAPLNFVKYTQLGDARKLAEEGIMHCCSCGCCQYICSSRIPLLNRIAEGRKLAASLQEAAVRS